MTLGDELRKHSAPAELCEHVPDDKVRCLACAHKCIIHDGAAGICGVRYNEKGVLRVPWGYTSGIGLDPIEKKPFFHVLPGASTLSFGMLGCNFRCAFCQNYITAHALKEPLKTSLDIEPVEAGSLVECAKENEAAIIVSTYNEPLITSEWAAAIFRKAKGMGMRCAYVSNGYATREVLDYMRPLLDLYKVDLKTFNADNYSKVIGGKLDLVLKGIEMVHEKGFWLEIVTLLIPGFNDSQAELENMASFIRGISPDIPWHITAFHPAFHMSDVPPTTERAVLAARDIGLKKGLKFVYGGNIRSGGSEDTNCPSCSEKLIERRGFAILKNSLGHKGVCPKCSTHIAGIWK